MSVPMPYGSPELPDTDDVLSSAWLEIRDVLQVECMLESGRHWIGALAFLDFEGGTIYLSAPTRFARDWVRNHLHAVLLQKWQTVTPQVIDIEIVIGRRQIKREEGTDMQQSLPLVTFNHRGETATAQMANNQNLLRRNSLTGFDDDSLLDDRYTFETFVSGASNEMAFTAAGRIADGDESVSFNPLFLHGGVGLGKTHLMHAIAWRMAQKHPEKRVIYLSAEQFMYRFVKALQSRDMQNFKEEFRHLDVLLIDDLQFISGKERTQEEFFHTFNALIDSKKQIVISADRSPSDMDTMEERIRSRLSWGLVVNIHQTDYSLRMGILDAKIKFLQRTYPTLFVPPRVRDFLAHRITSNVRELEGAVNRIAAHATFVGRPITLDMVEDIIKDLLRGTERQATVEEIQRKIADYYDVKVSDIQSSRRSREIVRPRQIAMYLSKMLTSLSLPEIGKRFGGKDHSTVLHSVQRVEEMLKADSHFVEEIQMFKNILRFKA